MLSVAMLLGLGAIVIRPTVAVAFPGPLATMVAEDMYDKLGFSPMPTNAVSIEELRRRNPGILNPRGETTQTCGYFNGVETDSFTCGYGSACLWNTVDYYFGCCSFDAAGNPLVSSCLGVVNPYTSCVPYSDAASCTGACYGENRVCDSTEPFCGVAYLFESQVTFTEYFCNSIMDGAVLTVLDSYTTDVEPSTAASTTRSRTTIIPAVNTHSINSGGSSQTTTTPSNPNTTQPNVQITSPTPQKKTNVGAIAGGVVGGLIALAAIVGGIILALHRKKKAQRQQAMMEVSQVPS